MEKKDNSILLLTTFLGNGCTSTDSMEAPAQSGPFPWPYVIHCRRLTLRGSFLLDTSLVTIVCKATTLLVLVLQLVYAAFSCFVDLLTGVPATMHVMQGGSAK